MNMWKVNSILLNNQWVTSKKKLKISGDKWTQKHNDLKSMGCSKSSSEGKFLMIQIYLTKQINNLK